MSETISRAVQFGGPHCMKYINKTGASPEEGHQLIELQHVTYGQGLREVCVLSLEERWLRGDSAAVFNNIVGGL